MPKYQSTDEAIEIASTVLNAISVSGTADAGLSISPFSYEWRASPVSDSPGRTYQLIISQPAND